MQYICVAGKTVSEKRGEGGGGGARDQTANQAAASDASGSKESHLCARNNSYGTECVHQAFVAQKGKDSSEVNL